MVNGEGLGEHLWMPEMQQRGTEEYLECRVEGQESLEDVLLVPETTLFFDPSLGILSGKKDVMSMNEYARRQPRQNLQIHPLNITPGLEHMTRIDEQHIAGTELLELRQRNALYWLFSKAHVAW
jgi:hypothetical protein